MVQALKTPAPTPTLISSVDFLEQHLGVHFSSTSSGVLEACCPFHGDSRPSLRAYPDGHLKCFSGAHGAGSYMRDVADVIRWLPQSMGGFREVTDNREALALAFKKARSLHLIRGSVQSIPLTKAGPALASADERAAMSVLLAHAHAHLLHPYTGRYARSYLTKTRGLAGPHLDEALETVGYLPYDPKLVYALLDDLSGRFGDKTSAISKEIGLTNANGSLRLRGRFIFASMEHAEHVEDVIYYQARICDDVQSDKRPKFLNPPHLSKQPYCPLPQGHATLPDVYVCEGPFDALAIASVGGYAIATLGTSELPPGELIDAFDNDAGAALRSELEQRQGMVRRLVYPPGIKDPASFLKAAGPDRFRQALERVVVVKKGRTK